VILVVDMDRFQRVAARFGDEGEAEAIRAVAARLRSAIGHDVECLARIGNDRFAMLVHQPRAHTRALEIAADIHRVLETPVLIGDEEIFVTASIGLADGTSHMRPGTLIQHADLAITELLTRGGSATLPFREGMQSLPALQLLRERDVRRAVARHEFTVHFQPIVGAMRGGLHAFEALLRWRNPEEGLLPPPMFLDVLNETGLIAAVGQEVIRESCAHAARWRDLCGSLVPVSVNIVPAQLYADGFCDFVAQTLLEQALPGEGLMLELTEEALIHDAIKAHDVLEALRDLGVRVMIDDFGTGYSSLSYLHDLPVSGLKLDRGFLKEIQTSPKQREIVRTIVRLAHFMGMVVVAEGIETADQLSAVRELNCDLAQGFRFARPFDADHATRYLTREFAHGDAA
jgi:diguanylate cyclase (GGDEF)-like protein